MKYPLFILLAVPVAAAPGIVEWRHDQPTSLFLPYDIAGFQDAPDDNKLHCRPEVIAAFKEAWKKSGSGNRDHEAGFRIDPRS